MTPKTLIVQPTRFTATIVFATAAMQLAFPGLKCVRRVCTPADHNDNETIILTGNEYCQGDDFRPGGLHLSAELFPERQSNIPYTAFGMVWNGIILSAKFDMSPIVTSAAHKFVDAVLVSQIDRESDPLELLRRSSTNREFTGSLASVVTAFNPPRMVGVSTKQVRKLRDEKFAEAVAWASKVISNYIILAESVHWTRTQVLNSAVVDGVLILENTADWGPYIKEHPNRNEIKFVVFPNHYNSYTIMAPNKKLDGTIILGIFDNEFRSVRNNDLREMTGISDALRISGCGSTAAARSISGCIALSKYATIPKILIIDALVEANLL